jgi:hypothetical protein
VAAFQEDPSKRTTDQQTAMSSLTKLVQQKHIQVAIVAQTSTTGGPRIRAATGPRRASAITRRRVRLHHAVEQWSAKTTSRPGMVSGLTGSHGYSKERDVGLHGPVSGSRDAVPMRTGDDCASRQRLPTPLQPCSASRVPCSREGTFMAAQVLE